MISYNKRFLLQKENKTEVTPRSFKAKNWRQKVRRHTLRINNLKVSTMVSLKLQKYK